MPALVTSYDQGLRWKTAPIGKEWAKILDDKGIVILTWVWQAGGIASKTDPIVSPDDAKGKKVRGGSKEMDLMIKGAGGAVTNVPSNEIYNAMSSGVLDGALTSSTSLISFKLSENSKAVTTARNKAIWFMFEPLVISKDTWSKLTPDQQKIMMEVGASLEPFAKEAAMADDKELAAVFQKAGAKVVDMDEAAFLKWQAIARDTAYKDFESNVKDGKSSSTWRFRSSSHGDRHPGHAAGMPAPAATGLWSRFVRGLAWFNTLTGYLSGIVIVVCSVSHRVRGPGPLHLQVGDGLGNRDVRDPAHHRHVHERGIHQLKRGHVTIEVLEHVLSARVNRGAFHWGRAVVRLLRVRRRQRMVLLSRGGARRRVSNSSWAPKLLDSYLFMAIGMTRSRFSTRADRGEPPRGTRHAPLAAERQTPSGLSDDDRPDRTAVRSVTLFLLFSGMPIAFALGLSALGFMAVFMPTANLWSVAETMYAELDNFTLLTIPLFVLMGAAIGKTRAGSDVYGRSTRGCTRCRAGSDSRTCSPAPCSRRCAAARRRRAPRSAPRHPAAHQARLFGRPRGGAHRGRRHARHPDPPSLTLILYGLASETSIGRLFMAGSDRGLC
jgi:hypothetical protein